MKAWSSELLALGLLVMMSDVGFAARVGVAPPNVGDRPICSSPRETRSCGGTRTTGGTTVVAYGGGWRFNRTLEPGESVGRVFDEVRAGGDPYEYRCTLHSSLVDGRCEGVCGLIHVFTA